MQCRGAWVVVSAAVAMLMLAVPQPVRAAFGFEFECGKSSVLTGTAKSKSDSKWPKAVISALLPTDGFVNGAVKETVDDSPSQSTDHYNYLRLEYVVGGPTGMPVAVGRDLCPVLSAFASLVNVRWHYQQKCRTTKSAALAYVTATAHDPNTGLSLKPDVRVAMDDNRCTPQVTLGIPHDSVFGWLQEVTTGASAAHLTLLDTALATLTTAVNNDVDAAILAVSATAPAPANGGARLKALLWFVRRYVDAFTGSTLVYLKQNTQVLMRTHFNALMHELTAAEKLVLTALQPHYHSTDSSVTDQPLTFCKLAWPSASAAKCARNVVTATVNYGGGKGPDITVHQWLTELMANRDPYAGASGGSMGHIAYDATDTLVVMEFRHTHANASPATVVPWVWSVYDYAAKFIAHTHGPVHARGPAPVWDATVANACVLPDEKLPPPSPQSSSSCVMQFLETRLRRKALRRIDRAAAAVPK